MRNMVKWLLCLLLGCSLAACTASADEHVGQAEGYGGMLKVRVKTEDGKLTHVEVIEHNETENVGTRAITHLPGAMVLAGTWDVDTVSGATITSNALRQAVRSAMGEDEGETQQQAQAARSGVGMAATGRIGPGTDSEGAQVYSFNVVFAQADFDQNGRVLSLNIDQLEVLSPNGGGQASFSGFPGESGTSEEDFLQQVEGWVTKGQLGENYQLPSGTWRQQMDAYESLFVGMTVEEIEDWYSRFCSSETGKPLQQNAEDSAEQTQYAALSEDEQAQLADVTSSASIALRSEHGDILTAIRRAWEDAQ